MPRRRWQQSLIDHEQKDVSLLADLTKDNGTKCDRASYQTMLVYQVGELARADGGVNIYQQSWLSATVGRCRLVTTIEEETRDNSLLTVRCFT